jgi:hypothetical protein
MRARSLALVGLLLLALAGGPAAHAAAGLTLGFFGDPNLTDGSTTAENVWIPTAVREGAGMVRINVLWDQVAPAHRPAGFVASDPASPGYNWTATDAAVRQLRAGGLAVLINISMAPKWAEGPHQPRYAPAGTWRPSAAAFGAFASAAAERYDGSFPDPLKPGASLPRVRDWQGWNEPNLAYYLGPQWLRINHRWVPESPVIFRALTNAFYKAVKGVSKSNFVVMGGTAPYGDPPGGARIPPVDFDRFVFCLSDNARMTPTRCSDPIHVDAVDDHTYGIGGPLAHALDPGDVAVPDLYLIGRVVRAAQRAHHVLPRGSKPLWVTEISWDSKPPNPQGVPIQQQARWYEQAMYVLWRQGVHTILLLQLVDSPPIPNYASTYQGGLYYLNGKPKPSAVAYRFPFVTRRLNRGQVQAWGRAPQAGRLTIEQRHGSEWKALKRLTVGLHRVFLTTLSLRGKGVVRALVGSQTSLPWSQS